MSETIIKSFYEIDGPLYYTTKSLGCGWLFIKNLLIKPLNVKILCLPRSAIFYQHPVEYSVVPKAILFATAVEDWNYRFKDQL